MPAAAIVITTHNRPGVLDEAVDAALAQTLPGVEVVVADDASQPPARVQATDRVELVRLVENGGQWAAANAGLARVRAPLVLFCDDDDRLRPRALERLAAALAQFPSAVAAIGARERWVRGRVRKMPHPRRVVLHDAWDDLLAGWSAVPGQVLIRTDALRGIGGWRDDQPADRDLLIRLAELGPFALVPEVVLSYRNDPSRYLSPAFETLRQALFERALERVPPGRRPAARLAIRGGAHLRRADRLQAAGHPGRAALELAMAVARAPRLLASPLLARQFPIIARESLRRAPPSPGRPPPGVG